MNIEYYGHFSDHDKDKIFIHLLEKKLAGTQLPEVQRVIDAKTTQMIRKINVSPEAYVKAMEGCCEVQEVEL